MDYTSDFVGDQSTELEIVLTVDESGTDSITMVERFNEYCFNRKAHTKAYVEKHLPPKTTDELEKLVSKPVIDRTWTQLHEQVLRKTFHQERHLKSICNYFPETAEEDDGCSPYTQTWQCIPQIYGVLPSSILGPRNYLHHGAMIPLLRDDTTLMPNPNWPDDFSRAFSQLVLGSPCGANTDLLAIMLRWLIAVQNEKNQFNSRNSNNTSFIESNHRRRRRAILLENHDPDVPFLVSLSAALNSTASSSSSSMQEIHRQVRKDFKSQNRRIPWESDVLLHIETSFPSPSGLPPPPSLSSPLYFEVNTSHLEQLAGVFDSMPPTHGLLGLRGMMVPTTLMKGKLVWDACFPPSNEEGEEVGALGISSYGFRRLREEAMIGDLRVIGRRDVEGQMQMDGDNNGGKFPAGWGRTLPLRNKRLDGTENGVEWDDEEDEDNKADLEDVESWVEVDTPDDSEYEVEDTCTMYNDSSDEEMDEGEHEEDDEDDDYIEEYWYMASKAEAGSSSSCCKVGSVTATRVLNSEILAIRRRNSHCSMKRKVEELEDGDDENGQAFGQPRTPTVPGAFPCHGLPENNDRQHYPKSPLPRNGEWPWASPNWGTNRSHRDVHPPPSQGQQLPGISEMLGYNPHQTAPSRRWWDVVMS